MNALIPVGEPWRFASTVLLRVCLAQLSVGLILALAAAF